MKVNLGTVIAKDDHKNFSPAHFVSCEKDTLRNDAYVMDVALTKADIQLSMTTLRRCGIILEP